MKYMYIVLTPNPNKGNAPNPNDTFIPPLPMPKYPYTLKDTTNIDNINIIKKTFNKLFNLLATQ